MTRVFRFPWPPETSRNVGYPGFMRFPEEGSDRGLYQWSGIAGMVGRKYYPLNACERSRNIEELI